MQVPRLLDLMEPATFYTLAMGVPAERHGRCLPYVWDPAAMRVRPGAPPALPAVWDRMAAAGLRSLVIDAYEIPEPTSVDGVFVRGLQHRNRISVPACRPPARARPESAPRPGEAARAERDLLPPERVPAVA